MGAWKEGPFDNDNACDYMCGLEDGWITKIESAKPSQTFQLYDEVRAIAAIITSLKASYKFSTRCLTNVVNILKEAKSDEDWIDSWMFDKTILKEINKQIKQIEDLIK